MSTWDAFDRNTDLCLDGRVTRRGSHAVAGGGFADVWEGMLDSRRVAIKIMRQFDSTGGLIHRHKILKRLWREYLAWSSISHPNILECLGFCHEFSPASNGLPSLISPWMGNGTLTEFLKNNPEVDRSNILIEVAEGLAYLHTREPAIVHGDLRAGNILVSDHGVPCLSDFGLARTLTEVRGMTTSTEIAGSLRWMSPELLKIDGKVTVQSDVWAFGMTTLEIVSGERPYATLKSDIYVFGQVKDGHLPDRMDMPDHLWSICESCWALGILDRPSMGTVISMLLDATAEAESQAQWVELKSYLEAQIAGISYPIQSVLSAVRSPASPPSLNVNITQIVSIVSSVITVCKNKLPSSLLKEGKELLRELSDHSQTLSEVQATSEMTKESIIVTAKSSFAIANALKSLVRM